MCLHATRDGRQGSDLKGDATQVLDGCICCLLLQACFRLSLDLQTIGRKLSAIPTELSRL